MSFLARWFLGVFTNVAGWFMAVFTRKTAIVLAVVTVIITMTVALATALKVALASLSQYSTLAVPEPVLDGIAMLMPDNFEYCLTAMFSARVTLWAYNFNKDLIKMYLGGI
ncbi:hypothetical protein D3C84_920950 [compost metagenome]